MERISILSKICSWNLNLPTADRVSGRESRKGNLLINSGCRDDSPGTLEVIQKVTQSSTGRTTESIPGEDDVVSTPFRLRCRYIEVIKVLFGKLEQIAGLDGLRSDSVIEAGLHVISRRVEHLEGVWGGPSLGIERSSRPSVGHALFDGSNSNRRLALDDIKVEFAEVLIA